MKWYVHTTREYDEDAKRWNVTRRVVPVMRERIVIPKGTTRPELWLYTEEGIIRVTIKERTNHTAWRPARLFDDPETAAGYIADIERAEALRRELKEIEARMGQTLREEGWRPLRDGPGTKVLKQRDDDSLYETSTDPFRAPKKYCVGQRFMPDLYLGEPVNGEFDPQSWHSPLNSNSWKKGMWAKCSSCGFKWQIAEDRNMRTPTHERIGWSEG